MIPPRLALLLAFLLGLGAAASVPAWSRLDVTSDKQAAARLLQLMRQRLLLMPDVARWKWHAGKAITDGKREQILLQQMVQQGRALGLEPDRTHAFFLAQMQAGKQIQADLFARWRRTGQQPANDGPDLATLRQHIDKLNRELLTTLVRVRPFLQQPAGITWLREHLPRQLTGQPITVRVRELAAAPLLPR